MSDRRGQDAARAGEPKGASGRKGSRDAGDADALPDLGDGPASAVSTAFKVALPSFEGPLDLLLHLIREHKVDILDIPISLITEKYLEQLAKMRELDLDVAGEFLVMAATLAHIKSRMLLPRVEPLPLEEVEEQGDPREELVRRLLNYQKYRDAAEHLGSYDVLDRDVFTRKVVPDAVPLGDNEVGYAEVSVFKLVEALDRALKNAKFETPHQVLVDRVTIGDTITKLVDRLKSEPRLSFFAVLAAERERLKIILTFLALLEMAKLKLIRIYQEEEGEQDIVISARDPANLGNTGEIKDEYK